MDDTSSSPEGQNRRSLQKRVSTPFRFSLECYNVTVAAYPDNGLVLQSAAERVSAIRDRHLDASDRFSIP